MTAAAFPCPRYVTHAPVASVAAAWRVMRNLSTGGEFCRDMRFAGLHGTTIRVRCVDGMSLEVHVAGAGRPIVLVHGLGGSHEDWSATAALMARSACVYRFDQRGHASRSACGPGASLQQTADDVAALIEQLDLEQPILVGHSLGALTVMQYLSDHGSERIGGVCFVDQSPRVTTSDDWALGVFGSLTAAQLRNSIERLRGSCFDTVVDEVLGPVSPRLAAACRRSRLLERLLRRALSRLDMASIAGVLQSLVDCDFRSVVHRLGIPALVVLGGCSSHYGGLPLGEYYQRELGANAVSVYSGSGHSPHRQEPARFAAELLTFATGACAAAIH